MSDITRRETLSWSAAFALASMAGLGSTAKAKGRSERPNILFIMADDLGYADLGCYGRRDYETPALDQLAAGGVAMMHGYANSAVCSATRTALITGAYQYRLRCGLDEPLRGEPGIGLDPSVETMPRLFKKLGYTTSLVGKWHLGSPPEFSPLKSGYDTFFGIQEGGADYFLHNVVINGHTLGGLFEGDKPIERHGYMTDLLTERAVAEINHSANNAQPFFMSLHYTAPHWPWEGPEDEVIARNLKDSLHWDGGNIEIYARMMKNMDDNIARLLQTLEATGQADNTIIVFTSDNGGERFSDTWPLTGGKGELLEGGIRVPIIIRWPGRIKAGTRSDQVMTSMDFLPTLLSAAGGQIDPALTIDGIDLSRQLTGQAPPEERTLFWRFKGREQEAVRHGNWKYLKIKDREYLFDLAYDQRERANFKDRNPEVFVDLKAKFERWNAAMLPYPANMIGYDVGEYYPDR